MPQITNPLKSITAPLKDITWKSHVVNDRVNELCCTNAANKMTDNIYGEVVP
jgi:hypothetical protein